MRLRYRMAQNATDVIRSTVYAEEPDHTVWLVWLNSMQNCKISVIISYYFLISWQVLPLQLLPATLWQVVPRRGCAALPSAILSGSSDDSWAVATWLSARPRPGDVEQYSWTSTRGSQNGTLCLSSRMFTSAVVSCHELRHTETSF